MPVASPVCDWPLRLGKGVAPAHWPQVRRLGRDRGVQGRDQLWEKRTSRPSSMQPAVSAGLPLWSQPLKGSLGVPSRATLHTELAHMEQGNIWSHTKMSGVIRLTQRALSHKPVKLQDVEPGTRKPAARGSHDDWSSCYISNATL